MKMNHREALKVLDLPQQCTFEDIKKAYRIACSKYHPDRNPAGLEMMKIINGAYQSLSDYVADGVSGDSDFINEETLGDEMNAALNAIIDLGLTIEVCGSWIWVSGDTRPHREVLKAAGYHWAPKKVMWHWRPADSKSYSRGKYSMDEVRAMHGSMTVKGKGVGRLERAA